MQTKLIQTKDYLLLIDEEAEIKENDYLLLNNEHPKGRIRKCFHLTNNNALWNGKDWNTLKGKHFFIDPKESEGWGFVTELECKKIIAYYPLTKEAKELDLPLLPSFEGDVWVKGNRISVTTLYEYEEQQDWPNHNKYENLGYQTYTGEVIELDKGLALKTDDGKIFKTQGTYWFGSILDQNCKLLKAAQLKQFSLEDVKKAIEMAREQSEPYYGGGGLVLSEPIYEDKHTEEEIIQSLSTQQLPKEFIPEWKQTHSGIFRENNIPYATMKTITNSEGKKELVGTYKY